MGFISLVMNSILSSDEISNASGLFVFYANTTSDEVRANELSLNEVAPKASYGFDYRLA